jgi:plasmid stabilization system protein ParE
MAAEVRWLPEALNDVEAIAAYVATHSPHYASALILRLLQKARSLKQFPCSVGACRSGTTMRSAT